MRNVIDRSISILPGECPCRAGTEVTAETGARAGVYLRLICLMPLVDLRVILAPAKVTPEAEFRRCGRQEATGVGVLRWTGPLPHP
jgi:hypothetical protein